MNNGVVTLWEDDGHLNHTGAQAFTRKMMPHIKQILTQNNKK